MNESDFIADPGQTEAEKDKAVIDFHTWYKDDLAGLGVNNNHLIVSTSRAEKELSRTFRLEHHGINSHIALSEFLKRMLSWDDFPNGDGPDPYALGRQGDGPHKREPSLAQAQDMRRIIIDNNLWGYAYYNRAIDSTGSQDIKLSQFDVLEKLSGEK